MAEGFVESFGLPLRRRGRSAPEASFLSRPGVFNEYGRCCPESLVEDVSGPSGAGHESGAVEDLQVVGDGGRAQIETLGDFRRGARLAQLGQELLPRCTDQRVILCLRETVGLCGWIDDQRSAWGRRTWLRGAKDGSVDEGARRQDHCIRVQGQLMDAARAELNNELAVVPLQVRSQTVESLGEAALGDLGGSCGDISFQTGPNGRPRGRNRRVPEPRHLVGETLREVVLSAAKSL